MGVIRPTGDEVRAAADMLTVFSAEPTFSVGIHRLPNWAVEVLRPVAEFVAQGKATWWDAGEIVPDDERPKCAECREPVELADDSDPESWVHAIDANDGGDHSAWL